MNDTGPAYHLIGFRRDYSSAGLDRSAESKPSCFRHEVRRQRDNIGTCSKVSTMVKEDQREYRDIGQALVRSSLRSTTVYKAGANTGTQPKPVR